MSPYTQTIELRETPKSSTGRRGGVQWSVVVAIGAMHLACLAAPFFFSWSALALTAFLFWFTGALGITLCYHRLLCHRSFRTPKWFEYVLVTIGCTAWQGGPIQWVGVHRIHHRHSDKDNDPHSPKHGFAWSHIFWCMFSQPEGRDPFSAARDLTRDPWLRFIDKYFWVPQFLLAGLVFLGGEWCASLGMETSGLSWLLWGVCVRTVLVYHSTWFVNSASHTWGYRNFETNDGSTNLWWVALIALGEGWHNNHHAHQRSAAHGMRWFELDLTYLTIRLLACFGLAREIILPPPREP